MKAADEMVLHAWGKRIQAHREALGLSQVQASARIGCSQSTLSKIENGDYRMHPAMILKICIGLDLDPERTFQWPPAIVDIAKMRTPEAAA